MAGITNAPVDAVTRERLSALGVSVVTSQDPAAAFQLTHGQGAHAYLVSHAGLVGQLMDAREGYAPGAVEIMESLELRYLLENVLGRRETSQVMKQDDLVACVNAFSVLGDRLVRWGFGREMTGDTWAVFCMLKTHPFNRMRKVRDVAGVVAQLREAEVGFPVLREALVAAPRGARWLERATGMALMWGQHPELHPRLLADMFA